MRRLDLYGLALDSVKAQDAETLAPEAYSAGVNAWIAEVNKGARGRGAPEFWLFSPEISRLGAGGFHRDPEADGAATVDQVQRRGAARAAVAGAGPSGWPTSCPRPGRGRRRPARLCRAGAGAPRRRAPVRTAAGPLSPVAGPGMAGASNAWARPRGGRPRAARCWPTTRIWG
jgi:penicillin amidase